MGKGWRLIINTRGEVVREAASGVVLVTREGGNVIRMMQLDDRPMKGSARLPQAPTRESKRKEEAKLRESNQLCTPVKQPSVSRVTRQKSG